MCILPLVIGLLMGCTSFMQLRDSNPPPKPSVVDDASDASLDYALSVYQKADYPNALALFSTLAKADIDTEKRRAAQLGEICCRLMLADSQADVDMAMAMWKQYRYPLTGDALCKNLVLLDPLLARFSVSVAPQTSHTPSQAVPTPSATAENQQKQLETELTNLKKKAAQTTQLQRQLDAVMAENRTLKQKIKALEAIDQNIQKKKTEISAPSE